MSPHTLSSTLKIVYLLLFFLLFALAFLILKPFLVPLGWALVLAISTWPLYRRLQRLLPSRPGLTSTMMCLGISVVLLLIVVPVSYQLSWEAKSASNFFSELYTAKNLQFPALLKENELIGERLIELENKWNTHRVEVLEHLLSYQNQILTIIKVAARGLGKTIFVVFVTIFSVFFLFRYGEDLTARLTRACRNLGGESLVHLIELVHSTIQATVYGVLLTSIVQGILAGVGFYIVGAPAPVLLGILTSFLSFIPFGPPFLYVPIALYMIFSDSWVWGLFLLAWSTFLVSMADNVLRPLFISHATSMSLLLVLLGILGGIAAFGLIGVFVGPVVIAVCQKVWIEFTDPQPEKLG